MEDERLKRNILTTYTKLGQDLAAPITDFAKLRELFLKSYFISTCSLCGGAGFIYKE